MFSFVIVSMLVYNSILISRDHNQVDLCNFSDSPPIIGSLMYNLITIGSLVFGKCQVGRRCLTQVRGSMEYKAKIYRSIWVSYALVAVLTILNGVFFALVRLTRRSRTRKNWHSSTTKTTPSSKC